MILYELNLRKWIGVKSIVFNRVLLIFSLLLITIGAAVYMWKAEASELNQIHDSYQLIVVGTDPEGIAAAVSAARNGIKTLLIDKRSQVGGLLTVGGLNSVDINSDKEHPTLIRGIYLEWYRQIEGTSFDIYTAEEVFNQMIKQEKNIDMVLSLEKMEVWMEFNEVKGMMISNDSETKKVRSSLVIDATQNADIAYQAGAPFTLGQEDFGGPTTGMAVTLVFEVKGVDWRKVREYLNTDDNAHTGADAQSAWGYGNEMKGYEPTQPNLRMRGLNIGLQNNGNVLINAMHIFNVNGLDLTSVKDAFERANKELPSIEQYLNDRIVGFENAKIVGTAEELYIRETRHLVGEYRLTIDDVLEHRDFNDKVVIAGYPVDVQATSINDWGAVLGNPVRYSVPYRSMVPLKVDGMLVVGRSASFDSLAHGSARTIPVGMGMGEAAGVAAAHSVNHGVNFRDIAYDQTAIEVIQSNLKRQGAFLENIHLSYPLERHWAYDTLKYLRQRALVKGGYNNDYKLDDPITGKKLAILFQKAVDLFDLKGFSIPDKIRNQDTSLKGSDFKSVVDFNQLPKSLRDRFKLNEPVPTVVVYMLLQWLMENHNG
jgi:hypothetical protein